MSDKRYAQANREALLSLGLYLLFFLWWFGFAFGLGAGDPEDYSYVWGLPAWFFYSCVVGYPLLSVVLWLVVHFCFKDMPLDADEPSETVHSPNGCVCMDQTGGTPLNQTGGTPLNHAEGAPLCKPVHEKDQR